MRRILTLLATIMAGIASPALACEGAVAVCSETAESSVALVLDGVPAMVLVDDDADPAVARAARDFAKDLGRVSGTDGTIVIDPAELAGDVVIIGVAGQGGTIDRLAEEGKIDLEGLVGQWEAYRQFVIADPYPGITRALVIAGADRRGAVYGTYDVSERMGVSPWYWWADVPVEKRKNLFLTAGQRQDQPRVRYRGFFINDEDPAFSGWARKQFGGVNADAYEHVFELLLRLKGNYLWPAMWGKAFHVDDPRNTALADSMGVVMGTSHHEPLTRAQKEWNGTEMGAWNYETNGEALREFWRGGIERMASACGDHPCDSLVTIGMRGDGDEAMSEETAIPLLEQVVADQREIIADVTGLSAGETPQVWALYKEVQDYYDQGMEVPDDVILLFADDNWGQVRRLPPEGAKPRKGGYGVYYHFDYVGGPRSYKWLNTVQIGKVWQQMDLAWQRGARDLWVVNVGDLKPMEVPLGFFMAQAWNPESFTADNANGWLVDWSLRNFGGSFEEMKEDELAGGVFALVSDYSKLAARRKPELVNADSFALGEMSDDRLDGGEYGEIVKQWHDLWIEAFRLQSRVPQAYRNAYFQLVYHPILANYSHYAAYYSQAWNRRLAEAGDPRANYFADQVDTWFEVAQQLRRTYHQFNGGKWDGMMSQTHFGYTSWNDPKVDVKPEIQRIETDLLEAEITERTIAAMLRGGVEQDWSSFSIPVDRFDRTFDNGAVRWQVLPMTGRTGASLVSSPQGLGPTSKRDNVRVEYDVDLAGGPTQVALFLSPTLDTQGRGGLRVGVSLDDGPLKVLTFVLEPTNDPARNQAQRDWENAVRDNNFTLVADLGEVEAGPHVLKLWRIDDNVVVQNIGIGPDPTGGLYLGPPELPEIVPLAPLELDKLLPQVDLPASSEGR